MDIALWVVAGLLAVVFLGAGVAKLTQSKDALYEKKLTWVEDFSDGQVKGIGVLEALGGLGLILPAFVAIGRFWIAPL